MKAIKITRYVSTGLLSALLLMSAGMYIFKNADITELFSALGYPTYIIYPLAVAKILAVIAIWAPKMPTLKEWAYSALFFEFLLAISAHLNVNDGEFGGAVMALILLILSYFTYKKLNA
ncbi:DoxX family protein [Putridiphycobacter roseus]|uniref:DoxX family protein n=1 Tax=Putridiphycobacter roseus TaxID=2219161 RepID=A0A2W1NVG4_9FLAO|nr:DoxX family protein [Putridiphycobacter roseus]PZE18778.1 DoxX family protein [Putridiphycobacter roseus]